MVQREHDQPIQVSYARTPEATPTTQGAPAGPLQDARNARHRDLDPQLVWRGKDLADWSDLVVNAPPLYIQEKVHPKVLIDDLKRQTDKAKAATYVVQTAIEVVKRCILMATDPGDLVLDPTCGSGTTAYVAEQWGRRWITIDTSRVALALARACAQSPHERRPAHGRGLEEHRQRQFVCDLWRT